MQAGVQEWKERISIRSLDANSKSIASSASTRPLPGMHTLTPHLCYACHTTLTSHSSRGLVRAPNADAGSVPLPVWTHARLRPNSSSGELSPRETPVGDGGEDAEVWTARKLDKEKMRGQVKDFFLDD
jgi:cytoplasmic tRNA 2-thiolation protein 2